MNPETETAEGPFTVTARYSAWLGMRHTVFNCHGRQVAEFPTQTEAMNYILRWLLRDDLP